MIVLFNISIFFTYTHLQIFIFMLTCIFPVILNIFYHHALQLIKLIIKQKMNPDYTSDIRQVQRFIMEHNLYLLTMFQKKLDSFSTTYANQNQNPSQISSVIRKKEIKQKNLNNINLINCDSFLEDPIKNLSRDLTKPIWNCITKVDSKIIFRKDSPMQPVEIINIIGKLMQNFFSRYKNQHEDQSNLKVHLQSYQFDRYVQKYNQQKSKQSIKQLHTWINKSTSYLFILLLQSINRQLNSVYMQSEDERTQECIRQKKIILNAGKQIFNFYLKKTDQDFNIQLNIFNKIVITSLSDVINCKTGSLVLCLQPKLLYLPLLVHPLLISLHGLAKLQIEQVLKREQQKNNRNNLNMYNELSNGNSQGRQKKSDSEKQEEEKQNWIKTVQDQQFIFTQIPKCQSISKIVFINFDGFQSQHNMSIVKYLSKSLMYVSFPKQSTNKYQTKQEQDMKNMQDFKSQRLLYKYFYGGLTKEQKNQLVSMYKPIQKQSRKRLYMFPIHSRKLAQLYNLPLVYNYQSSFIQFIMSEIVYNEILDYNPSLIVISYSQKINIQEKYFVEIMKELTVLGNYKIVFYANFAKNYLFEEFYSEKLQGLDLVRMEQKYFNKYQSHMKVIQQPLANYDIQQKINYNALLNKTLNISQNKQIKINYDIFKKISMMVKISSGTYNLSKKLEEEQYLQKFRNYKAMSYAGQLIKVLSQDFPNLNRINLKLNDYVSIVRVLRNQFNNRTQTFDKYFSKVVPKIYFSLFSQMQKLLQIFINKSNKQQSANGSLKEILSQQQQQRRAKIKIQLQQLKSIIQKKYNSSQRKQCWGSYKFQRFLQISTQKVQSKYFAHIPLYEQKQGKNRKKQKKYKIKKQAENVICLQFYISLQKEKIPIEINANISKIYYSRRRCFPKTLVYLINYLVKNSSTNFMHYYGVVEHEFDYKISSKLQMFPISFIGGPVLTAFETFTEFNYHESQNYIFMFWPKIYDLRKQVLSNFCEIKYSAQSTGLLFRAYRNKPQLFELIYDTKPQQYILPRNGCQCYQVEGTNTIYIFGGLYSNEKNYFLFQTDITRINYQPNKNREEDPKIQMENVPKQFYFDYEQLEQNREIKIIKNIKNDMIRPRIQYQFLDEPQQEKQMENAEEIVMEQKKVSNRKAVFVIGGVGQSFVRAYSMIGFMANKVIFNSVTGDIEQIKRIPMQNIIPVNTHNPIKIRSPIHTKILSHAQNRSICLQQSESSIGSYTVYHNTITYNPQTQRFEYDNQYQFTDLELKSYKQQISLLRKVIIADSMYKIGLSARTSRGKQFNTNFVTVSLDQYKYILELQLQLSLDIKYIHPDLPNFVRLTGASIISMDISGTVIYALIRHPIYTLDQCLLTYYDLGDISHRLKQNKPVQIQMKQLHKFEENVSRNILIAANSTTILIMHGQKFDMQVNIPQMIIRRNRKKYLKIDEILPNNKYESKSSGTSSTYQEQKEQRGQDYFLTNPTDLTESANLIGSINCSIFINENNGDILCFSFKSISRTLQQQIIFISVEILKLKEQPYGWHKIFWSNYQFIINPLLNVPIIPPNTGNKNFGLNNQYNSINSRSKKRQQLKLVQIIQHKVPNCIDPLRHNYELIAFYKEQCISGKLQFETYQKQMRKVVLAPLGKTVNQYFKQISKNTTKQYSVYLDKNVELYSQFRQKDQQNQKSNGESNLMREDY